MNGQTTSCRHLKRDTAAHSGSHCHTTILASLPLALNICNYDDGNMTYKYMRGNGTGEATVENTYTYDALHRVISAHENYGNKTRTYQYDSLGNLTHETELGNQSVDYKFNNLNQITKKSEDSWNTQNNFTYDRRGNLIRETNTKNGKVSVAGEYTYDETNKLLHTYEKVFEEITFKDVSTELIPVFNKAEQVNSATEIAIAFVAFMSAIASQVPGDEAAAGAALNRLLTVAGVI